MLHRALPAKAATLARMGVHPEGLTIAALRRPATIKKLARVEASGQEATSGAQGRRPSAPPWALRLPGHQKWMAPWNPRFPVSTMLATASGLSVANPCACGLAILVLVPCQCSVLSPTNVAALFAKRPESFKSKL